MSLKDLIQKEDTNEKSLEALLKGKVDLIQIGGLYNVRIKKEILKNLKNQKSKILLYLAGKLAWQFIEKADIWTKPKEFEKELALKGGTVRPNIIDLKNNKSIEYNKKEKSYRITSLGVLELEGVLDDKK